MYTLREICENKINQNLIINNVELGDSYTVVYKVQEKDEKYDKNDDAFEHAFESYFEEGFGNEKERSEIMKNIKAFVLPNKHTEHNDANVYPIHKDTKAYIMSDDGKTFEKL